MAPLKAIEETTSSHRCYVATKGKRAESSFQYEFHLPGDPRDCLVGIQEVSG